jgi:hypothetical protein
MAITKVVGNILADNLQRGANLSIQGNLAFFDITNSRVGILNSSPTAPLHVIGNIIGSNVNTGGVLSATGNVIGGNITTGGLVSATGNVSGGNLLVTGNIVDTGALSIITGSSGNINLAPNGTNVLIVTTSGANIAGTASASGNITGGNLITGGLASATGNITGGNILTGGLASATGNITGGNLITGGLVSATGNLIGNYLLANIAFATGYTSSKIFNGTTEANIGVANGNANISVGGTSNVAVFATTGLFVTGVSSASGNITGGNIITAGQISATGNLTANNINLLGAIVDATGHLDIQSVATNGNINLLLNGTGIVTVSTALSAAGNVTGGNLITTGLTSTGTLITSGDATIAGNLAVQGNLTYINVSELRVVDPVIQMGGGANGAALTTNDGKDRGSLLTYYTTAQGNAFMGWDNSSGNMVAASNVSIANDVVTFNSFGTFQAGNAYLQSSTATGNVSGGNLVTAGLVSATGNLIGNYLLANIAFATGYTSSKIFNGTTEANIGVANGNANISVGGTSNVAVFATTGLFVTGVTSATGNITGGNLTTAGSGTIGNIVISGSNINSNAGRITMNSADADVDFAVDGDTLANVFYIDAGTGTTSFGSSAQTTNAIAAFNTTNSILLPTGNTAQRPATGVTGMVRFNTTNNVLEYYTANAWQSAQTAITTIVNTPATGDGTTVAFTLPQTGSTNGTLVTINGVTQDPIDAYSVSGTTLTFTEAPYAGADIQFRQLTTTTSVTSIQGPVGASFDGNASLIQFDVTGNLVPVGNGVYSLGSATNRWDSLFVSGNTITMGNVVMKNVAGGNTIAFYGPDGTTPATIASTSVDTTTIANGTSAVSVIASGGNIRGNVGGATIFNVSSTGIDITGNLSVSGNATLSGNILGDRVQNGTTSIDIQTPSGNANITVGGTSNVAVFSTTGQAVNGVISATGNITGSFILGNGSQLTGIDATSIQSGTSNVRVTTSGGNVSVGVGGTSNVAVFSTGGLTLGTGSLTVGGIVNSNSNGVGNIGSSSVYFNTIFAKATSAVYADLAEKYVADAEYAPGTVLAFGGDQEVTLSVDAGSTRVAGVVSTNPSYIMNAALEAEHVAMVALQGRVPCRVVGTVRKGDLMVSAGNGAAQADNAARAGTIIGKALENFDGSEGTIEVVIGRN